MKRTNSSERIVLFTPYFAAKTPERQAELDECLRNNVACHAIAKIVLLVDDGHAPPVADAKLERIQMDRRPTYQQWIDFSKELGESSISILANSDIYFDDTLGNIRSVLNAPETFMALSRYDKQGQKLVPHPDPHWSQDTWALHSASGLPETLYNALDIPLGVPRCDNRVAYLFAIHGWKIVNPIKYLHSVHLHETQQRNYDKKADSTVLGGVAYVHPGNEINAAATVDIDIWVKGAQAIKKVALNKSLDKWAGEMKSSITARQTVSSSLAATASKLPAIPGSNRFAAHPVDKPSGNQTRNFITAGTLVYNHLQRFRAYHRNGQLLCLDGLYPGKPNYLPLGENRKLPITELGQDLLAVWIPPVIDTSPVVIKDRPAGPDDCHFWQYPCATEKQAYENHLPIKPGANIDVERRLIHTYLPLPWATYIDKKHYPPHVVALLRPRLLGMKSLAEANGYTLAVHTVCQQIHWRRFVEHFHALGITDLHLSHCEKSINPVRDGYNFRVHSWPLFAVNVEDPTRSAGIVIGKPISEKRYLASFIGAHMPHYRSDVRLKLLEAAKTDGGNDILVDLGGEWHFNKIVYQEQVANKAIKAADQEKHDAATRRYNEILSDSIFSLCPEGAGPNTLRVWESLAVGAIPVIIAEDWFPPKIQGSNSAVYDCCIFVGSDKLIGLFARLRSIKRTQVKAMQAACLEAYERARSLWTYYPDSA